MMMSARIDFSLIKTIDVARDLLGKENPERSTKNERHFPGHQGLYVNPEKNKWFSHGNADGGDALDLVCFVKACDKSAGIAWLRSRGHIQQSTSAPPTAQARCCR